MISIFQIAISIQGIKLQVVMALYASSVALCQQSLNLLFIPQEDRKKIKYFHLKKKTKTKQKTKPKPKTKPTKKNPV